MTRTLVIVPAYEEGPMIGAVVGELVGAGYRVLVVDDGSTDDTAACARAAGALVVTHPLNLGQGAALQTGFDYAFRAGAERVVTFDADGQHRTQDVARLCEALDHGADVALGSRGLGGTKGATLTRRWLLRIATWVSNVLSGVRLTDAHCGLRALRMRALRRLELSCNGMAHASELLTKIAAAGLVTVEVPVVVEYTEYSRAKGQRASAALRILFDLTMRAQSWAKVNGS